MERPYADVRVRTLERIERRVSVTEELTPLVIEAQRFSDAAFLVDFLRSHSTSLLADIARHGALLLRGFDVGSPADFERAILAIRGMRGMRDVLLSEAGRTVVAGTDFVLHTNTIYKTGGTLQLGSFHNENYFVPDVPRYISFLCQRPSKLGGETGLVNTAKVYADLSEALKWKLEVRSCLVAAEPLSAMSERYAITEETIERFCIQAGLEVVDLTHGRCLVLHKPSVIVHPTTRERALQLNFGAIRSLSEPMHAAFAADYRGYQWMLHRATWRAPRISRWALSARIFFTRPRAKLAEMRRGVGLRLKPAVSTAAAVSAASLHRLSPLFSQEDAVALAAALRRRYSSFLWKAGDVLVLDNLKIAHSGMAGWGERELKAMICNPMAIPCRSDAPGLFDAPSSEGETECLGAQLLRQKSGGVSAPLQHIAA